MVIRTVVKLARQRLLNPCNIPAQRRSKSSRNAHKDHEMFTKKGENRRTERLRQ